MNYKNKKNTPTFGDLVILASEMRRVDKASEEYKKKHNEAVGLIKFLNSEFGEGYCNLRVANKCVDEQYVRNKVKLARGA